MVLQYVCLLLPSHLFFYWFQIFNTAVSEPPTSFASLCVEFTLLKSFIILSIVSSDRSLGETMFLHNQPGAKAC